MRSDFRTRPDKPSTYSALLGALGLALILNALVGCSRQQPPIEEPATMVRYTRAMEHCDAAPKTDADALAALLTAKKFEELDAELRKFQAATEKDITCEQRMFEAFADAAEPRVYGGSEEILIEDLLNQWVRAMPESFVPYSVRSEFFVGQGYDRRGGAYAGSTSKEQFRQMDEKFKLANADLEKGITLYPRHLNFYQQGLRMARSGKRWGEKQALYQKAIEAEPGTYEIRGSLMKSLEPRWGGSFESMTAFAEDAQRFVHLNPRLRLLLGAPHTDRGHILLDNDKYKKALVELDKALSYGDIAKAYYYRGWVHYSTRQYEKAIQDLDRALEEFYSAKALTMRAVSYHQVGDTNRALEELNQVLNRSPNDTYALDSRAWISAASGRFEQARADYERSVSLKPRPRSMKRLGEVLCEGLGLHKEAAEIYAKLIALEPDNLEYRFLYGQQLHHLGDLQAKEILTNYLTAAAQDTGPSKKYIRQARQYLGLTSFDPEHSENVLRGLRHLGFEGETQVSVNSETNSKLH